MCAGNVITIIVFGIFEALLGACLCAGWICDSRHDDSARA
jgi:hypothetical protein